MTKLELLERYDSYKRGYRIGAAGTSMLHFDHHPPPPHHDEWKQGYSDGNHDFTTRMRKKFDALQAKHLTSLLGK